MDLDFDVDKYIKKIKENENSYFHTFINQDSLAAGVLVLQPGEEDTQEPHESDEVYFILKGNGFLKVATEMGDTVHQCWDCDSEGEFYETTDMGWIDDGSSDSLH